MFQTGLPRLVRAFVRSEQGAVSIDYVVLASAIVSMGVAVAAALSSASSDVATNINDWAVAQEIDPSMSESSESSTPSGQVFGPGCESGCNIDSATTPDS